MSPAVAVDPRSNVKVCGTPGVNNAAVAGLTVTPVGRFCGDTLIVPVYPGVAVAVTETVPIEPTVIVWLVGESDQCDEIRRRRSATVSATSPYASAHPMFR